MVNGRVYGRVNSDSIFSIVHNATDSTPESVTVTISQGSTEDPSSSLAVPANPSD